MYATTITAAPRTTEKHAFTVYLMNAYDTTHIDYTKVSGQKFYIMKSQFVILPLQFCHTEICLYE